MYWGRKPGTLINGLRGSLDVRFPSVPGLFTETKLCSIPSPTQQPQRIPVTSRRHTLKNNHPPATETPVLPTPINTHITLATYIHILLCLCPISMLGSEILIFYYHFSFLLLLLMAEWNPRKQNKTPPHAANILQNEATHDCSEVFISFTQSKTRWSRASTAQMS